MHFYLSSGLDKESQLSTRGQSGNCISLSTREFESFEKKFILIELISHIIIIQNIVNLVDSSSKQTHSHIQYKLKTDSLTST